MPTYATVTELAESGVPATAFGTLTTGEKQRALDEASGEMDGYFAGRFALPLTAWDHSVRKACIKIAVWNLLSRRGFNPVAGADTTIRLGYEDAIAWCKGVQRRAIHPVVTESVQSVDYQQPRVISQSVVTTRGRFGANRGW